MNEAEGQADQLLNEALERSREPQSDRRDQREDRSDRQEQWGFADIAHDLTRMFEQAEIYARLGRDFPGVVVEGETLPVPVDAPSLVAHFGSNQYSRRYAAFPFPYYEMWPFHSETVVGGFMPNAEIRGIPPDAVRQAARQPLLRGLANRLLGRSRLKPTATGPFTLECKRKGNLVFGQTAFYTPAYFIVLGPPFGSGPTTPVSGSLPPNFYHFGVDRVGGGVPDVDWIKRFDIPVDIAGTIDV